MKTFETIAISIKYDIYRKLKINEKNMQTLLTLTQKKKKTCRLAAAASFEVSTKRAFFLGFQRQWASLSCTYILYNLYVQLNND